MTVERISTAEAIGAIRDQLAGLVSRIDTSEIPRPDAIEDALGASGPVWKPTDGWAVRCVDDGHSRPACVYLSSPEHYGGDVTAEEVAAARRIAMAILAACDWADGLASGVTQLDARREGSA